jgi:hypothetical protein
MPLKAVYYGHALQKIPLSSYASHNIVSRGIGGVIKPKNFYIPSSSKLPKVNTSLNVLDDSVNTKSEFVTQHNSHKDSDSSQNIATPLFKPIKVTEKELTVLKKQTKTQKKRKEKVKEDKEISSIPLKRLKDNSNHRFLLE